MADKSPNMRWEEVGWLCTYLPEHKRSKEILDGYRLARLDPGRFYEARLGDSVIAMVDGQFVLTMGGCVCQSAESIDAVLKFHFYELTKYRPAELKWKRYKAVGEMGEVYRIKRRPSGYWLTVDCHLVGISCFIYYFPQKSWVRAMKRKARFEAILSANIVQQEICEKGKESVLAEFKQGRRMNWIPKNLFF